MAQFVNKFLKVIGIGGGNEAEEVYEDDDELDPELNEFMSDLTVSEKQKAKWEKIKQKKAKQKQTEQKELIR